MMTIDSSPKLPSMRNRLRYAPGSPTQLCISRRRARLSSDVCSRMEWSALPVTKKLIYANVRNAAMAISTSPNTMRVRLSWKKLTTFSVRRWPSTRMVSSRSVRRGVSVFFVGFLGISTQLACKFTTKIAHTQIFGTFFAKIE